jgi:hypothetical protein
VLIWRDENRKYRSEPVVARRSILLASVAAGVITMSNRNVRAKASQPSTPVNLVWAPVAAIRKKIPVDNLAQLYGF